MEGQVRTFQVESLTTAETELATKITSALARINLLPLKRLAYGSSGALAGFLGSAAVATFADELAATFNVPLPVSLSGVRVAIGFGVTLALMAVGASAGLVASMFIGPLRRHELTTLTELFRDRRLPPVIQKLRCLQEAHRELCEIARTGGSLPLSPDELPVEVREFYPRTA